MKKTHKDVEYAVNDASDRQRIFKTVDEAASFAVSIAISRGRPVNLDVLAWSKAGAFFLYGDEGAEQYEEDPDASVFERIEIKANSLGRIR